MIIVCEDEAILSSNELRKVALCSSENLMGCEFAKLGVKIS